MEPRMRPNMKESTQWIRRGSLCLGLGAMLSSPVALAKDAPAAKKANPWKSSVTLGAALTRGNSDTVTINGSAQTDKKWDSNELAFGANAVYGEEQGKVTASSLSGTAQYNRLLHGRFYGFFHVGAMHDDIAEVAYRVTLSPGAGYYFIKNNRISLSGEIGPGYAFERVGGISRSYATMRAGEKFTWQINKRARFWQAVDFTPKADEWSDYVINAEVGLQTEITTHIAMTFSALDSYRAKPAIGAKKNDLKLTAGVTYKF